MKATLLILILSFAGRFAQAGLFFEVEYPASQEKAAQLISLSEDEKGKNFVREADQAACSARVSEINLVVNSYRKVELTLECQESLNRVSSTAVCQDSNLNAPEVQLREIKKKDGMTVDFGPLPEGVKIQHKGKSKKGRKLFLKPAWDEKGCQSLGKTLASPSGPSARLRCCRTSD